MITVPVEKHVLKKSLNPILRPPDSNATNIVKDTFIIPTEDLYKK